MLLPKLTNKNWRLLMSNVNMADGRNDALSRPLMHCIKSSASKTHFSCWEAQSSLFIKHKKHKKRCKSAKLPWHRNIKLLFDSFNRNISFVFWKLTKSRECKIRIELFVKFTFREFVKFSFVELFVNFVLFVKFSFIELFVKFTFKELVKFSLLNYL